MTGLRAGPTGASIRTAASGATGRSAGSVLNAASGTMTGLRAGPTGASVRTAASGATGRNAGSGIRRKIGIAGIITSPIVDSQRHNLAAGADWSDA